MVILWRNQLESIHCIAPTSAKYRHNISLDYTFKKLITTTGRAFVASYLTPRCVWIGYRPMRRCCITCVTRCVMHPREMEKNTDKCSRKTSTISHMDIYFNHIVWKIFAASKKMEVYLEKTVYHCSKRKLDPCMQLGEMLRKSKRFMESLMGKFWQE